jgi:hypothetical protein
VLYKKTQEEKNRGIMPIKYEVLEEGMLVMTTVSGVLTEEDSLAHETALINDPAIKPGFRELFDARRVTLIQINEETIKKIAEIDKKAPSKMSSSRCAVVANDEDAFRWQTLFPSDSSQTIIVFSDINTAKTWLGISSTKG